MKKLKLFTDISIVIASIIVGLMILDIYRLTIRNLVLQNWVLEQEINDYITAKSEQTND